VCFNVFTWLRFVGFSLKDIAAAGGRYSMFKVGPVISVNHGIGMASMSVVLHEVDCLFSVLWLKCSLFRQDIRVITSNFTEMKILLLQMKMLP